MSDLRERVAHAMWHQGVDAAIAIVLEEAAQVAENATFPEPQSMVEQAIVAGGKKTAANIAAAIRALKSGK